MTPVLVNAIKELSDKLDKALLKISDLKLELKLK